MNPTIVITDYTNCSITINGQRIPTHYDPEKGLVSQLLNSQVRELGHEPAAGKKVQYILFQGCELRQIRGGGYHMALLDLPRMTKYDEGDEVITSQLTPVPPPPQKKPKRRPRSSPPARRGPAAKFVPLFAACKALAEAWPTAANLDDLAAIRDSIADGLAIAKRVAGED